MPNVRVLTARPHRLFLPVIRRIGALYRQGEQCILLVPEQLTLQAEKELIEHLQLKGLFDIEVLSPSRLKQRVLAAVGKDDRMPLSSAGQQMAVHYLLETHADQLHYYRSSVSRRGFVQKLTALITDMKRGQVLPETLTAYTDDLQAGMQKEKFEDLSLLYKSYCTLLESKLRDSDDMNLFITENLQESELVKNRHVFTFGFDAMPEQLIVLLLAIAKQCASLTVGLICDHENAPDQELYHPVRQSIGRFALALQDMGIVLHEEAVPNHGLQHAPAITHLDAMLFAYPQTRMSAEQTDVFLTQYHSPFEEATAAARQILQLIQTGISPQRIGLLYPDQNGYPFAVTAALTDSGLPYYTDDKLPSLSHALVQYITAALHAMADGFSNDHMFALIKTGYARISFDEACTLENYAHEYGINYVRWTKPFEKGDENVRVHAEALRNKVMEPLITARKAIVSAREASQSLQAVIDLLQDIHAYDTLKQEEEALLKENLLVRAGQNSQVWQTFLELTDQLYMLADGKRIPLKYIADRYEAGFAAVSLAALPPAANMLHAGVLGHSLETEADVVFILGLNDGVLTRSTESLLTEQERALAQDGMQSYLGITEESRMQFARLDLKRAMTLPQKKLYLSYAKTDPAGNTLQPLDIVNELEQNLFESIPDAVSESRNLPASSAQTLITLSDLLRRYADGDEEHLPEEWKQRLAKLIGTKSTAASALRLVYAAGFNIAALPIAAEAAKKLFGEHMLSVSRLETFAKCPFQHFITYGLRPEEQKKWEITAIERGNFFHDSLQRFADIASGNKDYPNISDEVLENIVQQATQPLIEEMTNGPMGDGARNLASLAQAERVIRSACNAVTDHLSSGTFKLEKTEATFGYPGKDSFPPVILNLPDGIQIALHGRIDRIDRFDAPDGVYRRVIDYKSGAYASLDAAQIWYGQQLQLMIYLDAATRNTNEAKAAGAFYFHLFDPIVKTDTSSDETIAADIQKQLQMNGLVLTDNQIPEAMDAGNTSVAIPAVHTKTGSKRKNAKALDAHHMSALMDHAKMKATQISSQMLAGKIDVHPVKSNARTSCELCEYASICGYDPLARGAQCEEIGTMSIEELAEKLDAESGNEYL